MHLTFRHPRTLLFVIAATWALIIGTIIVVAGPVDAHHPELIVTSRCDRITAIASAWATPEPGRRVNTDVRLTVDGVEIGRGSFTGGNAYTFTIVAPATPGVHVVRAVAAAPWGPAQEHGSVGTFAEATVAVAGPCTDLVIPAPTTTNVQVIDAPPVVPTVSTSSTVVVAPPIVLTPRFAG